MKKPELLAMLTEACQHPYGVKVRTSDPNRLRQKLYAAKKGIAEYAHLSFMIPANGNDQFLYILCKETSSDAEE